MLEEHGMSKHPAGHGGWESAEQSLSKKVLCDKEARAFPGGAHHLLAVPSAAGLLLLEKSRGHARRGHGRGFAAVQRRTAVELHPAVVLLGTRGCRAANGQLRLTSPKKARLRNPSNCSFPFPSTQEEVRRPEAASLGMQKEQDPGSWLHLPHRHQ